MNRRLLLRSAFYSATAATSLVACGQLKKTGLVDTAIAQAPTVQPPAAAPSLPAWFRETLTRANARQFLQEHIATVVGHYAGTVHSWDVVNEAIAPEENRPHGLRHTPWLELLGADYIQLAFQMAHQADPHALLVYNDYGLDYDTVQDASKRAAVLRLLERLKSGNVPIHALGI